MVPDEAGTEPTAFVVKCYYYSEKEEISRKAREIEGTLDGRSGKKPPADLNGD